MDACLPMVRPTYSQKYGSFDFFFFEKVVYFLKEKFCQGLLEKKNSISPPSLDKSKTGLFFIFLVCTTSLI
jgi:hypothetical protein